MVRCMLNRLLERVKLIGFDVEDICAARARTTQSSTTS